MHLDKLLMINCDQIPENLLFIDLLCVNLSAAAKPFTQEFFYALYRLIDSGKLRIKAVIKSALEFTRKTLVKILTFHASKSNLLSRRNSTTPIPPINPFFLNLLFFPPSFFHLRIKNRYSSSTNLPPIIFSRYGSYSSFPTPSSLISMMHSPREQQKNPSFLTVKPTQRGATSLERNHLQKSMGTVVARSSHIVPTIR